MRSKFKWIFTLLLALSMQLSFAQEKTVTGVVSDATGPVPGANVVVKGTKRSAQTDLDGKYAIKAGAGEILVFSFVGMTESTVVVGVSNTANVKMQDGGVKLEEVVIAFGKQDKRKMVQSVSVISAEKIKDVPVASAQDILQGQASGVQVVNSSGVLGSAPVIKIRGVASITAGGRPLFVVDGVPMSDSALTSAQGGQALNPLADINTSDIESLSVLKDAAATAVYGSRGSNGVVIITTKSGKKGQAAKVTLNTTTSWTEKTDVMDMMNADQYRGFLFNTGQIADPTDPTEVGQDSYDWVDAITRVGFSKNVDFSVAGGTEKSTYYVGANYSDQEGFIFGNGLRKNATRVNLTTDANDWLKVGINLGISETRNNRVGSENNTAAPLTSAFLQEPTITPFDANGNFVRFDFIQNVLAIESLDINNANTFRVTGNMFADLKLRKNLIFKTDFGVDRTLLEEFQRSFEVNTAFGSASDYWAEQNRYVFTNTLNFTKTFAEKHYVNVLGGVTLENTKIRDISVAGTGFASDDLINVESAVTKTETSNTVVENRLVGLFSRASYSYSNKYNVEASLRTDGSSRFGKDFKYGTFWSTGAAWVVSEENFLKGSSVVSNLKLKANYGISGNDRIGSYDYQQDYAPGTLSNYNNGGGLVLNRYANNKLKWEKSKSYDFGFEIGLFSNRIKLGVDYYNKRTTDLLLNRSFTVADNSGINSILENIGSMENKGFDIDLSTVNIKGENFEWSSNFNIGFNKNVVLDLGPDASIDRDGNKFFIGSSSQRAIVGHSVNTFFLIRYLGVNSDTGNAEWLDFNGNVTNAPTASDRVIVGDANPDFTGGFTNTMKYKNFDLNALINFSYGNDIMVDGLRFTEDARYQGFNKSTDLLSVWQNPGDHAVVPNPTSTTFGIAHQRSTRQLKDGSFARLKNVTLGYTLPINKSDKKSFISSARIYATASNLFTLKDKALGGIDPEVTNSSGNTVQGETFFTPPQSKTFMIGTRLTF
jgi:TonB-linked SusC/RagA family outer membrane protein